MPADALQYLMDDQPKPHPLLGRFGYGEVEDVRGPGGGLMPRKVLLTPSQMKATFNDDFRAAKPYAARKAEYRNPYAREQNPGFQAGQALRGMWDSAHKTPGRSMGTSAAIGGLGTFGGLWLLDRLRKRMGGQGMSTGTKVLLSLLGAGAAGLYNRSVGKNPSLRHDAPRPYSSADVLSKASSLGWGTQADAVHRGILAAKLNGAGLNGGEAAAMQRGIYRLSGTSLGHLSRLVRTMTGAAAGAAIGRFLLGKGLMPMLAGGMLGASVGNSLGSSRRNVYGRSVI